MRRRPTLIFNRDGIWTWDRKLLAKWTELALMWVGEARSPSGTGQGKSTLFGWTAASIGYAKRAGLMAEPMLVVKLETSMPLSEVPPLVRRSADSPVHSGDAKAFERSLSE